MIYLLIPVLVDRIEEQCRVFSSYSAMEQVALTFPIHSHYTLAYHGTDELRMVFVYLIEEGPRLQRYSMVNGSLSRS